MDSDLSALLMSAQSGATRQNAQIAVMRKAFESEQAVAQLVAQSVEAAPAVSPPSEGQGRIVDKQA